MTRDWTMLEEMMEFYECGYYFQDKLGRPVYIERPGQADFSALLKVNPPPNILKFTNFFVEIQARTSERYFQPPLGNQ